MDDPIDYEHTRATELACVADAPTHTSQTTRTSRMAFYRLLTSHGYYANSTVAVGDGTVLINVEGAKNAYNVAVKKMLKHELLKRQELSESLRKKK